jgi:methyl-accepting chemotaxis protein
MIKVYGDKGIEQARMMVSDGGETASASVQLSSGIQEMIAYNYKIANNFSAQNFLSTKKHCGFCAFL